VPIRAALVSHGNDLHAYSVAHELRQRHGASVDIIAFDTLAETQGFAWTIAEPESVLVRTASGSTVDLNAFDVVWLRRYRMPQAQKPADYRGRDHALENRLWNVATAGGLWSLTRPVMVNTLASTAFAENKIVQLRSAKKAGLDIPETLITSDRNAILSFLEDHGTGNVVAKLLTRPDGPTAQTVKLSKRKLAAIPVGGPPDIYQRCVGGRHHLRIHSFGNQNLAVEIKASRLDWRPQWETVPVRVCPVPDAISSGLKRLNAELGLHVAIHEFKVDEDGRIYYLETNTQGQFLFLEARGVDGLSAAMAEALVEAVG
jgi:hypothetical protein